MLIDHTGVLIPPFAPHDWYWRDDQGVIFSSSARAEIQATDVAYRSWLAAGGVPTRWPVDASGAQTIAALDDVLAAYGFSSGLVALSKADLRAYVGATVQKLLAATRSYTASDVTIKADATPATIANLLALSQWGSANPTSTENWVDNDYGVTLVTGAQFAAIAPQVGAYAQMIYGVEAADVLGQIASGAIATTAQIDAYAWTE